MPRIKPLGSKAKHDKLTREFEELIYGRLKTRGIVHNDIAKRLNKTRSAVSYNLKNINRMTFEDLMVLCDMLDLELSVKKKE